MLECYGCSESSVFVGHLKVFFHAMAQYQLPVKQIKSYLNELHALWTFGEQC